MIIYKKDIIKVFLVIIVTISILITLFKIPKENSEPYLLGGFIHNNKQTIEVELTKPVININIDFEEERFQRPSKQPALKLRHNIKSVDDFERWYQGDWKPPYIPKGFPKKYIYSEDVVQAYYAILKQASVMGGYHGGCGSIPHNGIPFPYAYELLSKDTKEEIAYTDFFKSFIGTGHTTLLKLYPAFSTKDTPKNIKHYMVEIEIITGSPTEKNKEKDPKPSYFAYYYGIVTTEYDEKEGWKIKSVDYIPEDFLCAPYHFWQWESRTLVEVIYKNWYKLIDKIDKVEKKDSQISIYASGKDNKYRFDFVRLTNGEDVLLHENIKINDKWKEVNLLKPEHQNFKLSNYKNKK